MSATSPTGWTQGRTGFVCPMDAAQLADGVRSATRLILAGPLRRERPPTALDERAIMNQVLRLYRWLAAV